MVASACRAARSRCDYPGRARSVSGTVPFQSLAGTPSDFLSPNAESASGLVSGAEQPGRCQVSLSRAVMLDINRGKNYRAYAGSSGCVPRPCAAPWLREGGNLMNAAMYAARILYHSEIPCISCVCESVRLCCPRPVGSQVPSALQEGLTSTATHPTRGCAFSRRIRRVDTSPQVISQGCRYPSASPSHLPALREYWLLRRKCKDAACVLHESYGIPAVAHVWKVHASLSLCRMRLAFAFDLVSPAISWKLGVWRGCDASVPPQTGIS